MGVGSCRGPCSRKAGPIFMKYTWSVWPMLGRKICSKKTKLLILDFDGTLTAIAKTPSDVVLETRTREVLTQLSQLPFCKLAIVSGRALEDLTSFFHIKNIFYAGNHGLELKGKGVSLPPRAKKAKKMEALVWLLGEKLKEDFSKVPGIFIEDKNYTLSLHYRNIPREYYPFFKQEVDLFRKKYAEWPLIWKKGKKVWDVHPGVKWDKGDVALHLAKKFPEALPIVIGDDVTDEDMFKVLKHRGITIRVGGSKKSLADYYLKSSADVRNFLGVLCRLIRQS